MIFGSIHHFRTTNWFAIDIGAKYMLRGDLTRVPHTLKKKSLTSYGWFRQSSTNSRDAVLEGKSREEERSLKDCQVDGLNSSSFQQLYITLVCPLRLLSVTLLRRSTEKNYVPQNARRKI